MKNSGKGILFLIILLLLVLPGIQYFTNLFKIGELDGDFILNEKPVFEDSCWFDGSFQSKYNDYIEDHIGFRNFFVRLNNAFDFYINKKSNAEGVIVGKENYLFEYDYIRAYKGDDFIGKKTFQCIAK